MPPLSNASPAPFLILYHSQATSARLRFLCLAEGVLAFGPLPHPLTLRDNAHTPHTVRPMPAAWSAEACRRLELPHDALEADHDFLEEVLHEGSAYPVLLARFTSIDPPFALAETLHARFISLLEARRRPALERELLRRAYTHILG
ncbi:hypothetical protein [Uliginosibacterium aquaticum]|uniref:Uncharacterized protein n=1 Tax=Uliginosibacterium aquaticum TaxID=2731212 RepID=A0ABX2IFT0_9RHOO|nr:hypothetical protein [Uliginosibacterium aquaticum]NSL54688.1 hypothetical protein [Uliginosibacterium aquaticum]